MAAVCVWQEAYVAVAPNARWCFR